MPVSFIESDSLHGMMHYVLRVMPYMLDARSTSSGADNDEEALDISEWYIKWLLTHSDKEAIRHNCILNESMVVRCSDVCISIRRVTKSFKAPNLITGTGFLLRAVQWCSVALQQKSSGSEPANWLSGFYPGALVSKLPTAVNVCSSRCFYPCNILVTCPGWTLPFS